MVPIRSLSAPFPSSSASSSASAAKFWLSLALCAFLPSAALRAEKPSPSPKKEAVAVKKDEPAKKDAAAVEAKGDKGDKADKADADSGDETSKMSAMMIPGQDVKGISYGHRDENGKLVMEFESEVSRKLDDENIEMENLKIIAYDEEGKKIDIAIPKSVFNLPTRILNGKDQIVIKREDFEIVGETGEFNTKTRFAKMFGNVKMTILNTENLDK
jgi:hypothetical protein